MTSGGLLGPRPGGGGGQKGPGRQLTKNRPNDVSRSHSDGLFEASKFSDFLAGGWLRVIICSLRVILYVNLHKNGHNMPKCDPKWSKMHVFLRTK